MSEIDHFLVYRGTAEYWLDIEQGDSVGFMRCYQYILEAIKQVEKERGAIPSDYSKYFDDGEK